MAKIYSSKPKAFRKKNPKKETVSFLLNYSKSLTIVETQIGKLEIIKN